MDIGTALNKLNAKPRGQGKWRAPCPAHGGEDDNLEIRDDGGKAFFTCYSHNCDYKDILAALGDEQRQPVRQPAYITPPMPDFPPFDFETSPAIPPKKIEPKKQKIKPVLTAVYPYKDEGGEVLFEKIRYEPKDFRQRVELDNGQYSWSLKGVRRVLYNLPAVTASGVVFIVEGEKDADALMAMGITATCNFDGAGKWLPEYNESLRDKVVYIIPDNDQQGDEHADLVLTNVRTVAKSARIVDLPGIDDIKGGDFCDWIEIEGNDKNRLFALCEQVNSKPAHKWKIRTLSDVPEEPLKIDYIIDPILPAASVSIWYGPPGSLKSMILKEMSFTMLANGDFIPGSVPDMKTKSSPILWLDMDNGDDVMNERIAAFRRTRNIQNDAPFFHVSLPDPWPFLDDINSQIDLQMAVVDNKIGLVIIDNLGSISGDIDENSAGMVKIMAPLRKLATETRAAIILLHHPRKGGANGGREGDALRGHSSIEAALDFAVSVNYDRDSNILTMRCTKARRFRFDDIKAQFVYTHFDGTRVLDTAYFCAPVWERGQNDVKDTIMTVLESVEAITQERLKDQVYDMLERKSSKAKIKSWMDEMVAVDKTIEVFPGENNAKLYRLK